MAAAKALDKKWLFKELDRDHRRKAREKLAELRLQLRGARTGRKDAIRQAKERCRTERLAARERARALRIRGLAELREAARLERQAARDVCTVGKADARKKDNIERRRAELAAEAKYQAEMRRIDRSNKSRRREHRHATYIERRAESDDEVRANISRDLVPLFERVKRGIKATPRMSRTEAFLHYAGEHPDEVLDVIEDKTDALIRELEAKQLQAARVARPAAQRARPRYTTEELAVVPF
jgi:hypothetical protein